MVEIFLKSPNVPLYIYYLCTIFKSKVSLGMILLFTWHEVERFSRFFINWLNLPYLPYYYVTRLEHKASISLNSTQFSPKKSRQLLRRLFYDINTVCKIELHVLFYFSLKVQILWEDHKIWKNLLTTFWYYILSYIKAGDFLNF